jgi:hypothetical protein
MKNFLKVNFFKKEASYLHLQLPFKECALLQEKVLEGGYNNAEIEGNE